MAIVFNAPESKYCRNPMSTNRTRYEEVCCDPCDPCRGRSVHQQRASNTIKIQAGEIERCFHSNGAASRIVQFQQSNLFKNGYSQKRFL